MSASSAAQAAACLRPSTTISSSCASVAGLRARSNLLGLVGVGHRVSVRVRVRVRVRERVQARANQASRPKLYYPLPCRDADADAEWEVVK